MKVLMTLKFLEVPRVRANHHTLSSFARNTNSLKVSPLSPPGLYARAARNWTAYAGVVSLRWKRRSGRLTRGAITPEP
jgi:hypothetical protein